MKSSLRSSTLAVAVLSGFIAACNALLGVEDVVLGEGHGAPDTADGSAIGDGGDGDGDALRDGDKPAPREDGAVPFAGRAVLALGSSSSCARMPDGTVRCWGFNNANGQVSLKPKAVPGITDAVAIGSGNGHTCITRNAGAVFCWGYNAYGQLGDGTQQNSATPVAVSNVQDAVAIAGGGLFTCALLEDKTVTCWGDGTAGQLGDGTKTSHITAAPVKQLADVASIIAGNAHACAVRTNGDVVCWGENSDGQLGIGSLVQASIPTKLNTLSDIVKVAAADRSTCALQKGGQVYCWGANDLGQLGNGAAGADSLSPALVPSVADATSLWAGHEHVCAVRGSGAVVCWGRGSSGQLGGGTAPDAGVATPGAVVGVTASAVWAGGDRSCAIAQDGRAFCWGANALGQLGNGTKVTASTPVPVSDFP